MFQHRGQQQHRRHAHATCHWLAGGVLPRVFLAGVVCGLLLTMVGVAHTQDEPASERQAGIVVQFGDGTIETACVTWDEGLALTAEELLQQSGLDVQIGEHDYGGNAVCKIGDDGCDIDQGENCYCQYDANSEDGRLWLAYQLNDGTWQTPSGSPDAYVSRRSVFPGDVEAWVWGQPAGADGTTTTRPSRVIPFEQICDVATPTATSTVIPTVTPTATLTPTAEATPTATEEPTVTDELTSNPEAESDDRPGVVIDRAEPTTPKVFLPWMANAPAPTTTAEPIARATAAPTGTPTDAPSPTPEVLLPTETSTLPATPLPATATPNLVATTAVPTQTEHARQPTPTASPTILLEATSAPLATPRGAGGTVSSEAVADPIAQPFRPATALAQLSADETSPQPVATPTATPVVTTGSPAGIQSDAPVETASPQPQSVGSRGWYGWIAGLSATAFVATIVYFYRSQQRAAWSDDLDIDLDLE